LLSADAVAGGDHPIQSAALKTAIVQPLAAQLIFVVVIIVTIDRD
jgi:hypothetical protein